MQSSLEDLKTVSFGAAKALPSNLSGALDELKPYLSPGRPGTLGRLGHYDIREILGQGAFGTVVKAFDEKLQRLVAIKMLLPRFATTSPPRKFFLREARSAAKVRHEHVVQIHGVDETPLPYLVMEYIDGETLQDRLDRSGPLESADVVRIGRQIALGLAAAHEQGLIHRDIKPANILLEKGCHPRVKITDFGIARTADDASLTQSGFVVGTPMYMAPEQANGDPVDHRADLFSLGSVLYTMTSGRPPFRAPTAMAVLKRVSCDTPRSILEVNPEVNRGLCAVIARLHAKKPEDRFESAQEVADTLERCLTDAPPPPRSKTRKLIWGSAGAASLLIVGMIAAVVGNFGPRYDAAPIPVEPAARAVEVVKPSVPPVEIAPPVRVLELTWEEAVAKMPLGDQVPAVSAKLRVLNPGFDDSDLTYEIENKVVARLTIFSSRLANIAPIRALKGLRELRIEGSKKEISYRSELRDLRPLRGMQLDALHLNNSSVVDLSPLAGMQLRTLSVWEFQGDDLSPLRGMPLTNLNCGASRVTSLEPLRGMKLTYLCANLSKISDLSPLAGMPLSELLIEHTGVSDLTPVRGMPLTFLATVGSRVTSFEVLRGLPIQRLLIDLDLTRDGDALRSIPTLESLNDRPAADVLAVSRKFSAGS